MLVTGAAVARFGSRATLGASTAGHVLGFGLLALATATATATGDVVLVAAGACLDGICGASVRSAWSPTTRSSPR